MVGETAPTSAIARACISTAEELRHARDFLL
jgi:hypothetical protein